MSFFCFIPCVTIYYTWRVSFLRLSVGSTAAMRPALKQRDTMTSRARVMAQQQLGPSNRERAIRPTKKPHTWGPQKAAQKEWA